MVMYVHILICNNYEAFNTMFLSARERGGEREGEREREREREKEREKESGWRERERDR